MDLFRIIVFLIPPYSANAAPVVLGGGTPIDLGKTLWDGRRILGDGKTIRGLLAGLTVGFLVGFLEGYLLGDPLYIQLGVLSSCGAMFGDIFGSFIKRRLNIERGKPSLVMDQLLFIVFAILFSYPLLDEHMQDILAVESIVFILVFTYFMHRLMNIVANKLGLKKVPW